MPLHLTWPISSLNPIPGCSLIIWCIFISICTKHDSHNFRFWINSHANYSTWHCETVFTHPSFWLCVETPLVVELWQPGALNPCSRRKESLSSFMSKDGRPRRISLDKRAGTIGLCSLTHTPGQSSVPPHRYRYYLQINVWDNLALWVWHRFLMDQLFFPGWQPFALLFCTGIKDSVP